MRFWKNKYSWHKPLFGHYTVFKRLRHLSSIAATFFLWVYVFSFGCKKPKVELNDQLYPDSDKLSLNFSDTTTLRAYSVKEDSLITTNLSSNLVGYYVDPVFGISQASIYTQIRLSSESVDFGNLSTLEVDSTVLSLVYSGFYGKLTSQNFLVHKVTENLNADSSYYSTKTFSVESTPIGTLIGTTPNLTDSLTINDVRFVPHMRIHLSSVVGENLIQSASLSTNEKFLNEFMGLRISVDPQSTPTNSTSMLSLNLLHTESKVTVYYRTPKTGGFDTLSYSFNINSSCQRVGYFSHDYTNSEVEIALTDKKRGDSLLYIQAMAGIKTKIEIPYLNTISKESLIGISKAELVFYVEENTDAEYSVPTNLFLFGINEYNQMILLPDFDESHYGGIYNSGNKSYTFNVTRYIQNQITGFSNGENANYGLYLVSENRVVSARRLVLKGTNRSANPLRLKLYYSKFD